MKSIIIWLGKKFLSATLTALFFVLAVIGVVYALTFPSSTPTGQVVGGKFMQYFNSIKVACPSWQYLNGYDMNYDKICAVVPAGPQWSTGATGPQWPAGANGGSIYQCPYSPIQHNSLMCPSGSITINEIEFNTLKQCNWLVSRSNFCWSSADNDFNFSILYCKSPCPVF